MSSTPNGAPPSPTVDEVRTLYEDLPEVYAASDKWHAITHRWIGGFITKRLPSINSGTARSVLNLGSAGKSYGIPESALLHVDLHTKGFAKGQQVVVADIQSLPVPDAAFDTCLCVGSVVNHCDAARVISEVGRVLRPGGTFIIDFETSSSLELLGSKAYGESAAVTETFYQDRTVRLWAYSEPYVLALLTSAGFDVMFRSSRHHVSPLIYLCVRNSNTAASFAWLDGVVRHLPWFRRHASHVILACQKREPLLPAST